MSDPHLWFAFAYAAVPFAIGAYVLMVDADILEDETGKDELYNWIHEHRIAFLVVGVVFLALAGTEFYRFIQAYK